MAQAIFLAFPMTVVWLALSNEYSIDSFLLGYVLSIAIILLVRGRTIEFRPGKIPSQIAGVVTYTALLFKDILLSSIDVARRVLDPNMPINPDILPVSTQDDSHNLYVAGLSIHAITVTPGEMVVGYDEDRGIMYVHSLNVAESRDTLDIEQTRRLKRIRRILGDD